jgi:hypothetical protein
LYSILLWLNMLSYVMNDCGCSWNLGKLPYIQGTWDMEQYIGWSWDVHLHDAVPSPIRGWRLAFRSSIRHKQMNKSRWKFWLWSWFLNSSLFPIMWGNKHLKGRAAQNPYHITLAKSKQDLRLKLFIGYELGSAHQTCPNTRNPMFCQYVFNYENRQNPEKIFSESPETCIEFSCIPICNLQKFKNLRYS